MSRTSYSDLPTKKATRLYESSEEVKAWYDELKALKSSRTAVNYIECLAGFVQDNAKSPSELTKLNSDEAYELMKGWAIKRRGSLSDKRISVVWFATRSFLKFHKVRVDGEFPISNIQVKYLDKIPTKEELQLILDATSSIQVKISIQLMAYSGIRPEDIVDLTYGSIKTDFERDISPSAIYVPQQKTGAIYITFFPKQTSDLLRRYFESRKAGGERITDSSPVIKSQQSDHGIRRKTLTQNIELALKKSGIELQTTLGDKIRRLRPYCLRKYFRSNLTGHMSIEFSEAMVGRMNGLAQIYGGVRDLDPSTLERMRIEYKNAEQFLLVGMDENLIMRKVNIEIDRQKQEFEAKVKEKDEQIQQTTTTLKNQSEIIEKTKKNQEDQAKEIGKLRDYIQQVSRDVNFMQGKPIFEPQTLRKEESSDGGESL
ncbi:tyrosine-type recombinase/integrase [Candidatus Bathyarchaeota archaeon]|nr:tyrosine-type recombinase/integrase [Candidatus Bathyarchaeota archaeon]